MFDAGSQTILALAARSKYLSGCRIGFWGMLHTWGRDPCVYHPHIHFVVPGGGVREDGSRWQQTPTNFLFPHAAIVTVYKAKLADQLRACGLYEAVPAEAWQARSAPPAYSTIAITRRRWVRPHHFKPAHPSPLGVHRMVR